MPDTSAAEEPRTADMTAYGGFIAECVTDHAFSQPNNVSEWS